MSIRSPGSEGIRVEFGDFSVGEGKVWLHADGQVAGPYTGRGIYGNGRFWSSTIFAEAVTLEYEPAAATDAGARPPFEVRAISHLARPAAQFAGAQTGQQDTADYCHLDPNCFPEWKGAMGSVAHLMYEEDGARYSCSGSLVATRDNSFKPYLLTAGHCIHSEEAARSLEIYWTYQTETCGAEPPAGRLAGAPSSTGGHLLTSGSIVEGDYSLVLLREIPAGVTFAGWDVGEPPIGTPLAGLHHPTGSWKRISFGERVASQDISVEGSVAPGERYLDILWDKGRTEPGSSGSPLFSSPGVIVGILSYGMTSPVLSACQITPNVSGYGSFATAYGSIRDYVENLPAALVTPDKADLAFTVVNHAAPSAQPVRLTTESNGEATFKLRADAPWVVLSDASGTVSADRPAEAVLNVDPAQFRETGRYSTTVAILSGSAPPRFINITADAKVDRSNVVASISPNPVYATDGVWSFAVRLAETAGAPTRLTGLRIDGADYSPLIKDWFGVEGIAANGLLEAPLHASGMPSGDHFFEFEGTDEATGETWYRVAVASLR